MKRVFAVILVLVMVAPFCLIARAEEVGVKPFYGVTWGSTDRNKFPELATMPSVYIYPASGIDPYFLYAGVDTVRYNMSKLALEVRNDMRALPEGMRYMQFLHPVRIFSGHAEAAIYLDKGVEILKGMVTDFLQEYKKRGGLLDGVIMDLEYQNIQTWWIFQRFYQQGKTSIYSDIVNHPLYKTEVRPMLVERGFQFYHDSTKPEIWSIYPYSGDRYAESRQIWDNVMRIRLAEYLNEAVWEPLQEYYPGTHMSDYQTTDGYGWQKKLTREGGKFYLGGNIVKAGDTSNLNTYLIQPTAGFYPGYSHNPPSYNKAVYDNDSYNMLLWDVNRFKNMYEATDTGRVNMWISEYDTVMDSYYGNRESSLRNNAYYAEMLLHAGMLNPDVFLLFIPWEKRPDLTTQEERDLRYQAIADCLNELTDKVGAADRKPIFVPANWNEGFILSGMYAGGRNVWRITPDITNGTTLESFKVKDKAPTFKVNGKTIIFPQGRILETGDVAAVGSCGYWVETPTDVTPVILTDADRFSANPSYIENFDRYNVNTLFSASTVKEKDAWEISGTAKVTADGENKVLTMTGTSSITNVQLPKNITAGDSYAKLQAWEVSFVLPAALTNGTVNLLTNGTDTGFTITDARLSYDRNGVATQFGDVVLVAGTRYTLRREVNLNNNTCAYVVFANGAQIARAENIKMKSVSLPVEKIGFKASGLGSQKIYLDDYKLYPMGFTADFEVYNADTGIKLNDMTKATNTNVAYRLSWLNGSTTAKKATVVAQYYKNGALQSTATVGEIVMAPGDDGVETAIVESKSGMTVKLVLQTADTTLPAVPNYDDGYFDWVNYGSSQPPEEPTVPDETVEQTQPSTQPPEESTGTVPEESTDVPAGSTESAVGNTTENTVETTQGGETTGTTVPDATNPEKGNHLWVIFTAIGVVLVGGAVAAGLILLKKKQPADATETTDTADQEDTSET